MNVTELSTIYSKEVAKFYGLETLDPKVTILKNRLELNKYKGKKTENWLIGFAKDNQVYMLDKSKWDTESCHPKEQFEQALKHEIAHLYYEKYKGNTAPSWLNEGVSAYLSNQDFLMDYQGEISIKVLDELHSASKSHKIGATLVKKIVDEFGEEKLLEIIKIGDRETRYQELKKMFNWLK